MMHDLQMDDHEPDLMRKIMVLQKNEMCDDIYHHFIQSIHLKMKESTDHEMNMSMKRYQEVVFEDDMSENHVMMDLIMTVMDLLTVQIMNVHDPINAHDLLDIQYVEMVLSFRPPCLKMIYLKNVMMETHLQEMDVNNVV